MKKILFISILLLFINACQKDIIKKTDPRTVFEVFWQTMDERYVFFKEKSLNWDSIYYVYYPKINENTPEEEIINYYKEIINYIHDGHVAIIHNKGVISYTYAKRYYRLKPSNKARYYYSDTVMIMNPLEISQFDNDILYILILNFRKNIDIEKLKYLIREKINYKNGIIIDLRGNSGGYYIEYSKVLSLFFKGKKTLLYRKLKTGKEQNQFSDYIPIEFEGDGFFSKDIPVVVLTDIGTYSAGSVFAAAVKSLPNFYLMGETTGGGGGSITRNFLPNNWVLSYTYCKNYDINKNEFETGVRPDTLVEMTDNYRSIYISTGQDVVKNNAIKYLLTQKIKH